MTNNVKFAFSVGDTTCVVYNQCGAKQIELVTLNTTFNVVYKLKNTNT